MGNIKNLKIGCKWEWYIEGEFSMLNNMIWSLRKNCI